jgi:phage host-nuclease inhibitor protein Gam
MTAKAIKKTTVALRLEDWEAVDQSLYELGHRTRQKAKIVDRYDKKIEDLKRECAEALDEILATMDEEAEQIYLFTIAHLSELDGRSKTLTHGVVAFRKSTELKLPKKVDAVIAKLKSLGKHACIEVKEKIKKAVLKQEDPEVIKAVGGKLIQKDNFRIELPEVSYDYDKGLKVVK